MSAQRKPNAFTETLVERPHVCQGHQGIGFALIDPNAGLPLRIRRLENSPSLEVTLGREELIITGAQLDEFWDMIEALSD